MGIVFCFAATAAPYREATVSPHVPLQPYRASIASGAKAVLQLPLEKQDNIKDEF